MNECVKVLVHWVHENGLKDGGIASGTGCHIMKKVKKWEEQEEEAEEEEEVGEEYS